MAYILKNTQSGCENIEGQKSTAGRYPHEMNDGKPSSASMDFGGIETIFHLVYLEEHIVILTLNSYLPIF